MQDIKEKIITILEKTEALKRGDFTLASGEKSKFYIDLRVIPNFPEAFEKLIDFAVAYIKKHIEFLVSLITIYYV